MKPNKNNKRNDGDPFRKMIEEMMRSVDKMMKEDMNMPKGEKENSQNQPTDITFNFSFNPAQKTSINPQKGQRQRKENAEIIDGEKQMIAVLEIQNLQKEDLKTELKNPRKLRIRTPKTMKEIPLPTEAKEIKGQTYKNGVLEIKINKDQDENL